MELLHTIIISNYPRKILLTKSKRAKYYKPKDKLAKKYLGDMVLLADLVEKGRPIKAVGRGKDDQAYYLKEEFIWKNSRLYNTIDKLDIIKNPSQVGKENWCIIKGQDFYNQNYHHSTREKIVNQLHKFWLDELEKTPKFVVDPKYYPIFIHYTYSCFIEDSADDDNYAMPYNKTFRDCLVKFGILPDDKIRYINDTRTTILPVTDMNMATWGDSAIDTLTVKIYGNANTV